MDIDRLKRLAAILRRTFKDYGRLELTHGQALDLIAAVPGLRNWPEVVAFPDRVAASQLDLPAAERVLRAASRHGNAAMVPESLFYFLKTAEYEAITPVLNGTERLIVATCDSGAGHLKAHRIADRVTSFNDFNDMLVRGPVPFAAGPLAFYRAREVACDADPRDTSTLFDWSRAEPASQRWQELVACCAAFDRVELWLDPSPHAQLLGLQLLTWLGDNAAILEKLHVAHADGPLGERSPPSRKTLNAEVIKVGPRELRTASLAWSAYCQPTPAAWFALLADDLDVLPFLRRTVEVLLGELPAIDTGLGATERLAVDRIALGGINPWRFFHVNTQENPSRVYGFLEEIRLLNGLAHCPRPAILGLVADFDIMNTDEDQRRRYMKSELSLSEFGQRLHAGQADFARDNPIRRWWGGTLLTNDRLWRWDATNQTLVAPR